MNAAEMGDRNTATRSMKAVDVTPSEQGCGVDLHRVLVALMVGEAEESGLHSVGQHYECKRHEGVDIDYHPVLAGRKHVGVERYEAPVEEAPYYAA